MDKRELEGMMEREWDGREHTPRFRLNPTREERLEQLERKYTCCRCREEKLTYFMQRVKIGGPAICVDCEEEWKTAVSSLQFRSDEWDKISKEGRVQEIMRRRILVSKEIYFKEYYMISKEDLKGTPEAVYAWVIAYNKTVEDLDEDVINDVEGLQKLVELAEKHVKLAEHGQSTIDRFNELCSHLRRVKAQD